MGARPVANMNALRFGDPSHPKMRHLIAAWSRASAATAIASACPRSAARPTSTRLQWQHPGQRHDGRRRQTDKIFYSAAAGIGNPVVYVGSKTGRDGIHGATMARADFGEDARRSAPPSRSAIPFTEKLLIEACLELMASDAIVAIQDMGAAGLTSSSSRWRARAASASASTWTRAPAARRA
jgi:phosphoribosylformylglycinamidine synthase